MSDSESKQLQARIAELEQQLSEEREEAQWDLKAAREASTATIQKLEEELAKRPAAGDRAGGDQQALTQRALMAERKVAELQQEIKRLKDSSVEAAKPAGDSLMRQRAESAERERDELRRTKRSLERTLEEKERALRRAEERSGNTAELKRQLDEARRDLLSKERELSKARESAQRLGQGQADRESLEKELTRAREELVEKEEFLGHSQARVRQLADEVEQLTQSLRAAEQQRERSTQTAQSEQAEQLSADVTRLNEELARTRLASGQMLEQRERETERLKSDLSAAEVDRKSIQQRMAEAERSSKRVQQELRVARQERDEAVEALRRFREAESTVVSRPPGGQPGRDPFQERTVRESHPAGAHEASAREPEAVVSPELVVAADGDAFPVAPQPGDPVPAERFTPGNTEPGEPPMPTPDEADLSALGEAIGAVDQDVVTEALASVRDRAGGDTMPTPIEDADSASAPHSDPDERDEPETLEPIGELAEPEALEEEPADPGAQDAQWFQGQPPGPASDEAAPPERTAEVRTLRKAEPLLARSRSGLAGLWIGLGVLALIGILIVGALVFFPRWFGTEGVVLESDGGTSAIAGDQASQAAGVEEPTARPDAGPGENAIAAGADEASQASGPDAGEPAASDAAPELDSAENEAPVRDPVLQQALVKAQEHGLKLIKKRRHKAAVRHLLPWIQKVPDDAELRFLAGKALFQIHKTKGAIAQMEKAVELSPDYAEAWFELGGMYVKSKQRREARAALEKFLQLAPDDHRARAVRANLNKL